MHVHAFAQLSTTKQNKSTINTRTKRLSKNTPESKETEGDKVKHTQTKTTIKLTMDSSIEELVRFLGLFVWRFLEE